MSPIILVISRRKYISPNQELTPLSETIEKVYG